MRQWLLALVALVVVGLATDSNATCNYYCEKELGGCYTCDTGSFLEDCHVSCNVCYGYSDCRVAGPGVEIDLIGQIYSPLADAGAMLDQPYRLILEKVVGDYNSGRAEQRNPILIAGGVDVGGNKTYDFTLSIEQTPEGLQTMVVDVKGFGSAEILSDPSVGEADIRLTYVDGRKPILGKARLD